MLTLTKQEAEDIVWGGETDHKIIKTEITSHGRWSVNKRTIFEKDGKLYELRYSVAATEYQEQDMFDSDFIDCDEVEAVQVIDYKAKPRHSATVVPKGKGPKA